MFIYIYILYLIKNIFSFSYIWGYCLNVHVFALILGFCTICLDSVAFQFIMFFINDLLYFGLFDHKMHID